MPVPQNIKDEIDSAIVGREDPEVFERDITWLVEDILSLPNGQDMLDSASYLSYRVSNQLIRSDNNAAQGDYAQGAASALAAVYNHPLHGTALARQPPEIGLRVALQFYNFHVALAANGLVGAANLAVDDGAPLRLLRSIAGSSYGPPHVFVRNRSGLALDTRARVVPADGTHVVEIGPFARSATARNVTATTWNMQGEAGDNESKWTTQVLSLARTNDVVLLQEVGGVARSAVLLQNIDVTDQFGVQRRVEQYLWNVGTSTRPERYHVYFYDVARIRVNLAIVVPEISPLPVRNVIVVSDGSADPSEFEPRPALGIRIQGADPADRSADVTVYSFHAISGGGPNAPRMLREVAWHSETSFFVGGDFNRDPRQGGGGTNPGPWVSPPQIAQLDEAAGPTHPSTGPTAMLDYAVSNGTLTDPAPGVVRDLHTSDHLAVAFQASFPS